MYISNVRSVCAATTAAPIRSYEMDSSATEPWLFSNKLISNSRVLTSRHLRHGLYCLRHYAPDGSPKRREPIRDTSKKCAELAQDTPPRSPRTPGPSF